MADICWRKIKRSWKLFGKNNVVSFVENQLKLTESATDKNLSENAHCFFDQEAKFPPFRLI